MLFRVLWVTLVIALAWSQGGYSLARCLCAVEKSSCGMTSSECCCPTKPKSTCKLTHPDFHQDKMLTSGISVPMVDAWAPFREFVGLNSLDSQETFRRTSERPRIRLPAKTPPDLRSPPPLS